MVYSQDECARKNLKGKLTILPRSSFCYTCSVGSTRFNFRKISDKAGNSQINVAENFVTTNFLSCLLMEKTIQ